MTMSHYDRPRMRSGQTSHLSSAAHRSMCLHTVPFHARRKLNPFVTKQLLLTLTQLSAAAAKISDGDNGGRNVPNWPGLRLAAAVTYCVGVQLPSGCGGSCSSCLGRARDPLAGSSARQSGADSVQCSVSS